MSTIGFMMKLVFINPIMTGLFYIVAQNDFAGYVYDDCNYSFCVNSN